MGDGYFGGRLRRGGCERGGGNFGAMLIGHFSDLHGNLTALFNSPIQPDVWVDTGDFFPDDPV